MKIIISCAFIDELTYFKENYGIDGRNSESLIQIAQHDVLILNTGVGKVNSAMNLQKAIDSFQPDIIINSGCSGALTNEIPLYGIILSDAVFYHDFTPIEIMQKYVPDNGFIKADTFLIEKALQVAKVLETENVIISNIASGDCYVNNEDLVARIIQTGAVAVDMESAAIGHVSKTNDIPFLCIRSISDFADGNDEGEEMAALKAAKLTEALIKTL